MTPLASLRLAVLTTTLLAACSDPAKDKSHADVGAPIATTSAAAMQANPAAMGDTFAITAQNSKISWTGSKVTGSHTGTFGGYSGSISLAGDRPETGRVTLDIDMTTLMVDPDKLLTHLKSNEFFDVEKFPKATFVSTNIKPGGDKGASHTVTGNLTLHGVTKSISFPATIHREGNVVTVKSEFSINRRDFNVNYPGKPNDLIRDDILLSLDLHADKKG